MMGNPLRDFITLIFLVLTLIVLTFLLHFESHTYLLFRELPGKSSETIFRSLLHEPVVCEKEPKNLT